MNLRFTLDEDFIYKALIISLAVHLMFISSSLFVPTHKAKVRKLRKVEITYKTVRQKEPDMVPAAQAKAEPFKPSEKMVPDSLNGSVFIKERNSAPESLKTIDRSPDKNRVFDTAIKKSVSVPQLQSEKINNPSYQNYYSLVRSRIKQRAYFNYAEYYAGEVYLTFVLFSDGTLKDLKIIEEKSSGGQYLRTVGLKSIKEATPFPPFPKNLNYPELTFNVVISFQVKDQ